MGFSPAEIGCMSFWEFGAAVSGWNEANGGEKSDTELSADDVARLSALVDGADDGG